MSKPQMLQYFFGAWATSRIDLEHETTSVKLHIGFLPLFPLLKVEKVAKVEKRRQLFQARCVYFSSAFKSGFGFYKRQKLSSKCVQKILKSGPKVQVNLIFSLHSSDYKDLCKAY
jgi:hypothetical protein